MDPEPNHERFPSLPVTFEAGVLIERPAGEVYRLIEWGDPMNAKRQLGHHVAGGHPSFVLTLDFMPEHRFVCDVSEAIPDEVYAFHCNIQPKVGRLDRNHETYRFEAVSGDTCRLTLINEVLFEEGLTANEIEQELAIMNVATRDGLLKVKIHAERGVEVAKSLEHNTFC